MNGILKHALTDGFRPPSEYTMSYLEFNKLIDKAKDKTNLYDIVWEAARIAENYGFIREQNYEKNRRRKAKGGYNMASKSQNQQAGRSYQL